MHRHRRVLQAVAGISPKLPRTLGRDISNIARIKFHPNSDNERVISPLGEISFTQTGDFFSVDSHGRF